MLNSHTTESATKSPFAPEETELRNLSSHGMSSQENSAKMLLTLKYNQFKIKSNSLGYHVSSSVDDAYGMHRLKRRRLHKSETDCHLDNPYQHHHRTPPFHKKVNNSSWLVVHANKNKRRILCFFKRYYLNLI